MTPRPTTTTSHSSIPTVIALSPALVDNRAVTAVVVAIFALTYALIAFRRLRVLPIGRPAGALLGATLMVASGAITPEQSYHSIDGDTIILLLAMMLITAELELTGFFHWASEGVLRRAKTPRALLVMVAVGAAVGSALLVNDTVCLFMTPVVVATCRRAALPMGPYLIVLATSANLGSAATLVGNPQNMLIGSMSDIPFGAFMLALVPVVAVACTAHLALALGFYRKALPTTLTFEPSPAVPLPRAAVPILVIFAGVVIAFFAGAHLGYAAMAGAVALFIVARRDPHETFRRVDWTLLVFFAGLFIVTGALRATGLVDAVWQDVAPALSFESTSGVAAFTGVMTAGSNIVSNVPMVVLTGPYLHTLGDAQLGYTLLAYITTIAGNLTLVGSVANLIVAEGARAHYDLGFVEYLRFGALSTLLTLAIGVPLLCLWAPLVL